MVGLSLPQEEPYGLPLRWTQPAGSGDFASVYNDESEHMWEVVLDMDCGAVASDNGYFRFEAVTRDGHSTPASYDYEKAVEQAVCDGGLDQGVPFHEHMVHYGL